MGEGERNPTFILSRSYYSEQKISQLFRTKTKRIIFVGTYNTSALYQNIAHMPRHAQAPELCILPSFHNILSTMTAVSSCSPQKSHGMVLSYPLIPPTAHPHFQR